MKIAVSKKLSLGFIVISVILLASTFTSFRILNDLSTKGEKVVFLERKTKTFSKVMVGARTMLHVSDFVLTDNDWMYDYYLREAGLVKDEIANFKELSLNDVDEKLIKRIERKITRINLFNHKYFTTGQISTSSKWKELVYELDQISNNLIVDLELLSLVISRELSDTEVVVQRTERNAMILLAGITLFAFIVIFIIARKLNKILTYPIIDMRTALQKIAKGEPANRPEKRKDNEIGILPISQSRKVVQKQFEDPKGNHLIRKLQTSNSRLRGEIHERKNMEKELLKNKETLTEVQSIANLGSCEYDFKSGEFSISNEIFKMFELVPGNYAFENDDKLKLHLPELAEILELSFKDKFKKGNIIEYEYELTLSDETLRQLDIREKLISNKNGEHQKFIRTIADVTRIKASEQRLKLINKELSTFIYKASHDLKGPLSSVLGLAFVARSEVKDKAALKYIDMIEKCNKQLDTILMGLLSITKISQGAVDGTKVNVSKLLQEIVDSLKYTPKFKKINCTLNIDKDLEIYSDIGLMKSIGQNLIENAVKYSNSGSKPYIDISATTTSDGIQIEVSDNGIGIPKEIQKKVFEMFYRGHNESKGSGLGLYIVSSAIEKLNGTIQMRSKKGEGSTFTVFLPHLKDNEETKPNKISQLLYS